MVLACAAVVIPAILDFQQQESLARSSTIQYYHSVFDSPQGELLDKIATDGEIFYRVRGDALIEWNNALPRYERKTENDLFRQLDREWSHLLSKEHGDAELRALAAFLLKTADVVYECGQFRDLFKDSIVGDKEFKWGAIELDPSVRLAHSAHSYFDILGAFLTGFFGTRETAPQCHQESLLKLFGRRFSEPFWYLRHFLYCDSFIQRNFFERGELSDASALYRLESIAMAIEQTDLEFRFPDKAYAVMRTLAESRVHQKSYPESITFNFRLEPTACALRGPDMSPAPTVT